MSKREHRYVISYDITSNRIRNKIASELLNYGKRVQYSVFECSITEEKYQILYEKLLDLCCGEKNDSIRVYCLCENCTKKVTTIGVQKVETEIDSVIIV